jgi:hypothetical protein
MIEHFSNRFGPHEPRQIEQAMVRQASLGIVNHLLVCCTALLIHRVSVEVENIFHPAILRPMGLRAQPFFANSEQQKTQLATLAPSSSAMIDGLKSGQSGQSSN